MNQTFHSDIRIYWKSFGMIIVGMILFGSLPFLVKTVSDPRGFQLLVYCMAAIVAVIAWIYRPLQLTLAFEDGSINLLRTDGRTIESFPAESVSSIKIGPTGHVLRHELIWIMISLGSTSRKVGPFLLPNRTTFELDDTLDVFLKAAKEAEHVVSGNGG